MCLSAEDQLQEPPPGLILLGCLLGWRVLFVALLADEPTGEDAGIGFDDDPLGFAVLEPGNPHAGLAQPWCALEEHQPDRRAVKLLRADRAGCAIRGAAMLFVARRTGGPVRVQRGAETLAAESGRVIHVARPSVGPADVLDEGA
ncbi:hypothetical protein [Thiocapsa sp.]|uniref:hypothetical protein n=1 Tax=Thiocapsa sp. TaxID=2024551 RepID=UPI0035946557